MSLPLPILLGLALSAGQATLPEVPALKPPMQDAPPPTEAEMTRLREGYRLFAEKKYDEAIAVFQEMLVTNPESVGAMHEMALTLVAKGDHRRAIEMAARCASFRFPELDKCLALVGSAYDMAGEPARALEAYDRAIAILPTAGTLYYNKAVTEVQALQDAAAGLATLKRGAVADPMHAGTHELLGRLFMTRDLRTPAFLALSRFLILEPATARTRETFRLWYTVFNSNVRPGPDGTFKPGPDGKYEIAVNPGKPKDEGDLTQLDLHLALSQIDAVVIPFDTQPGPRLVRQFTTYMNAVSGQEAGADATTFLWKHYVPYFKELHARKHSEAFIYHVIQQWGFPGVREWLDGHAAEVDAFLAWDKAYAWR
jgi:tetratricopeptide (TPR) repeat protein